MRRPIAYMFLLGILTVFAGVVNAGPITLVGGSPGTIPGGSATNEFIAQFGFTNPIGGYYSANVTVDLLQFTLFTFEFFGAEASYLNQFWYGNNSFAHPGGTVLASSLSSSLASFSLNISDSGIPFEFWINGDSSNALANGSNPGSGANFFVSFDPFNSTAGSGGTTGDVLYVFLDDGGAGPDDNHDDFLVRITAGPSSATTPIPEPTSLILLGPGLGFLWLAVNRRRKK